MEVRDLVVGCEVTKPSIKDILRDGALQEQMRELLRVKGLVYFADQALAPSEEEAIMKLFPYDDRASVRDVSGPYFAAGTGIIEETTVDGVVVGAARWKLPRHPVIQVQGCGRVVDHHGVPDGELVSRWPTREWHTDGVHDVPMSTLPPVATSMYCYETPDVGGQTLFASGNAAFEALPPSLKQRALGLTAVYDATFRPMVPDGTRAAQCVDPDGPPTRRWPVVIEDSRGRPSLYVGPAFTRHLIEDGHIVSPERSQQILGALLTAGLEGNVYSHAWRPGDFVVWSNRSMLHTATPSDCYDGERRLIHRIRMASREPVVAYARDPLQLYVYLWLAQQFLATGLFDLLGTESLSLASQTALSSKWSTLALWALFLALAVKPSSKPLLVASHLVAIALDVAKLPMVWDYDFWDALAEAAVAVAVVTGKSPGPVARAQLVVLYGATALYKLTSSFLSSRTSCAPIFVFTLLDSVLPSAFDVPSAVVSALHFSAAYLTLLVEAAIPLLLVFWAELGVAVGLFFHLLIAVTPPPNNAGGFSVSIAVKYAFFATLEQRRGLYFLDAALVASSALLGIRRGRDWALPVYVAMACVLARRLGRRRTLSFKWRSSLVVLTALYAIVPQILGLLDMGAPTMFANLKVFAGSNHILLPTGLLFGPAAHGEILRVENTSSTTMNAIHPNEASHLIAPRVRTWLQDNGHTGRQFSPYVARVIGIHFAPDVFNGPYLIPATELKRLVADARDAGDDYYLEYTKLGHPPLRQHGDKVRFHAASRNCTVLTVAGDLHPCDDHELALDPHLSPWARTMLLFFSIPVDAANVHSELGCLS